MNKKRFFKITCGLLVIAAVFAPTVLAEGQAQRYFIKSRILRAITKDTEVIRDFENGYTAELTKGQLMVANWLGITVEEVPLYHIQGKVVPDIAKTLGKLSVRCLPTDQTPWGIETVYNDPAITATSGGAGVDVAVLDTGVNKKHLDLTRRVAQCKDFTPTRGVKDGSCSDTNGHGTHVAGTIAADAGTNGKGIYGVAPQARLFAYKVCGSGGSCWADDIATAIRTAANNGAEIISMSLGGDAESSLIASAIDYASGKGVLIVAAAGNDGPEFGSIDYPAANVNVMAAGAIDATESVPNWSSRGINDGDYVIEVREVEVGMPGVNVLSTYKDGCYATMSGTSMATPHTSGLAAKLWQGTSTATRTYLQELAKLHDLGDPGDDPATGFGLPQVP